MIFPGRTIRLRLAVWICAAAIAAAQTAQPRRQPDVPFVPTTHEAVQAMLKLAGVNKNDVVYDLGCGDGRIVVAAARDFGAHAVGIDIDPVRVNEARENVKKSSVEDLVRIEQQDLFTADIHQATVVTLFLLSSVNLRLRPKLLQDLKPGTRIVSNTFGMGDWKPDKELTVEPNGDGGYFSHMLYLWRVPERAPK
jgi:precorrin-6B methylase 2